MTKVQVICVAMAIASLADGHPCEAAIQIDKVVSNGTASAGNGLDHDAWSETTLGIWHTEAYAYIPEGVNSASADAELSFNGTDTLILEVSTSAFASNSSANSNSFSSIEFSTDVKSRFVSTANGFYQFLGLPPGCTLNAPCIAHPGEFSITGSVSAFALWSTAPLVSNNLMVELKITPLVDGDFDEDGDVDGQDFLIWQRNPSVGLLGDWEANYGFPLITTAATAVPEPSSWLLLSFVAINSLALRW